MRISDLSTRVPCLSESVAALQQSLVDRGDKSTLCLSIAKRRPGNGMIALSQPEEAARGQDDIGDLTGPLVEDELVYSAKFVAIAAMHSLPPHLVGRNKGAGCEVTGHGYLCIDGHGHSPFNKYPGRTAIAHSADTDHSLAMMFLSPHS